MPSQVAVLFPDTSVAVWTAEAVPPVAGAAVTVAVPVVAATPGAYDRFVAGIVSDRVAEVKSEIATVAGQPTVPARASVTSTPASVAVPVDPVRPTRGRRRSGR
nr:hypothetical protein GCM10025699_77240 [Microbacterium flavescens]